MKRFGQVIKIIPEKLEHYKYLHANQWPSVRDMLRQCHIQNYTMFEKNGYLFSYFEYTGENYAADMAIMAADPMTQKWGAECRLCQQPIDTPDSDDWWAKMEEIFHQD